MRIKPVTLSLLYFTQALGYAGEVNAAVAFERTTGHQAAVAYGTVGKFYGQIKNSASFDVPSHEEGQAVAGSYWLAPRQLYPGLRQDAVLLARGKDNDAAKDLLAFLGSKEARQIILNHGYDR